MPQQAPHESISTLDGLFKQFERKHTMLGTRLSLMTLQHNIQVPNHDGVLSYLQTLEVIGRGADGNYIKGRCVDAEEYTIPKAK